MDTHLNQTIGESKLIRFQNYRCSSLLLISNYLIVGTREGYLFVYDIISETKSVPINISISIIESITQYKDFSFFVSRNSDILLMFLEKEPLSLTLKSTLSGHTDSITSISCHNNILYSAAEDNLVFFWNIDLSKHYLLYNHEYPIIAFDLDKKTGNIATCCRNNILKVYNLLKKDLKNLQLNYKIYAIRFFNEGKDIVLGNSNGTILYLSCGNMSILSTVRLHSNRIKYLAVLEDSECFVSGSFDKNIKIIYNMVEIAVLKGHTDLVRAIEFDKKNRWLISCGDDGTVRIWDVKFLLVETLGNNEIYNRLVVLKERIINDEKDSKNMEKDRCCSGCLVF